VRTWASGAMPARRHQDEDLRSRRCRARADVGGDPARNDQKSASWAPPYSSTCRTAVARRSRRVMTAHRRRSGGDDLVEAGGRPPKWNPPAPSVSTWQALRPPGGRRRWRPRPRLAASTRPATPGPPSRAPSRQQGDGAHDQSQATDTARRCREKLPIDGSSGSGKGCRCGRGGLRRGPGEREDGHLPLPRPPGGRGPRRRAGGQTSSTSSSGGSAICSGALRRKPRQPPSRPRRAGSGAATARRARTSPS
jgi:hypothetical protein